MAGEKQRTLLSLLHKCVLSHSFVLLPIVDWKFFYPFLWPCCHINYISPKLPIVCHKLSTPSHSTFGKWSISDCLGPEWKCRIVWEGIQGNSFEWYKCLLSWLWRSTWIYKFIKTHQNVYLKWVHFIVFNYTSIQLMFFKVTKKAPLETQIKLYFNYTLHFKSNKIWIHFQSCQRKKVCHICENYTRNKYYRREMSRENN